MSFSLIHVSDLHLARFPRRVDYLSALSHLDEVVTGDLGIDWLSSHEPEVLRSAAEFVYRRRQKIQGVVVTGDLATSGYRPDDLRMVRSSLLHAKTRYFVEHPFGNGVVPTFAVGPPVFYVPGNHDRYASPSFNPGGRLFDQIVGWPGTAYAKVWTPQPGVRVVAIDCALLPSSQHANPPWSLAVGEVHDALLGEVRRLSVRMSSEELLIWLVHWPPQFPRASQFMQLKREDELVELASSLDVDLILSGHTHEAKVYKTTLETPVACCGTTAQAASGQRPQAILEITSARSVETTHLITLWNYSADSEEFVSGSSWRVCRSSSGVKIDAND